MILLWDSLRDLDGEIIVCLTKRKLDLSDLLKYYYDFIVTMIAMIMEKRIIDEMRNVFNYLIIQY